MAPLHFGERPYMATDDEGDFRLPVIPAAPGAFLPPDDPIEETPADRIAVMLGEAGGDEHARVRVYRVLGDNSHKLEFCRDYSPAEFEAGGLEMIRTEWGAGAYQIRLYARDATGRSACRAKQDVAIAEARGGPLALQIPTSGAPHPESSLGQLVALNTRLIEQLGKRDPSGGVMESLALVAKIKELFAAPSAAANAAPPTLTERLAELKALRELAADLAGPSKEPGDDSLAGMVSPMLGLISSAMQQRQQPQGALALPSFPPVAMPSANRLQQEPQGALAAPAPGDAAEGEDSPTPLTEAQQLAMLKAHVTALVYMGTGGVPVEVGAQYVYQNLPDDAVEGLRHELWWQIISQVAPDAAALESARDWFGAVRTMALQWIDAEADEESQGGAAL